MKRAIFILFYADLIPRHRLMARTLAHNGWEIDVVSWNRNWPKDQAVHEPWVSQWHCVPLAAGTGTAALVYKLPRLFRKVSRVVRTAGGAEAIFITHFGLLPLATLLRSYCARMLYDAPEYYCEDLLRYFGRLGWLARPVVRGAERAMLARVDAVLTIDSKNGWLADYYRRMNRPVHVVWNTPSTEDDPAESELLEAVRDLGAAKVVVYVGALKRDKGLEVMLRAIPVIKQRFPGARFLFIGGLQERRELIDRLLRDLGIGDVTIFKPPMPYRRMLAYLRASAVGLAVLLKGRNRLAGAGNCRKIFTYMQGGLPIVVSDVGSVGELVRAQACGVCIDGERPEAAAAAICAYLDDDGLAREHGRSGRQAFTERFNWERQAAAFLEFIDAPVRAYAP
ncbi:MAG: glycosyltransferase [Gammaproteobacteria bacterium]